MTDLDLKLPEDFEAFQKLNNLPTKADFRRRLHETETELNEKQQRHNDLRRFIDKGYESNDADLDNLENAEAELKDCKSEIKKLFKERKKIEAEREETKLQRAELHQQFLEEAAPYLKVVVDHYSALMEEVNYLNENLIPYYNYRSDLRTPPPVTMDAFLWKTGRQDKNLASFYDRIEEIENGNYTTRELTKLR